MIWKECVSTSQSGEERNVTNKSILEEPCQRKFSKSTSRRRWPSFTKWYLTTLDRYSKNGKIGQKIRNHAKTQTGWTSAKNTLTAIFCLNNGSPNSQSTARVNRLIKLQMTMLLNSVRLLTDLISCHLEFATTTIWKTLKTKMTKENKMREKTQQKSFAKCVVKRCAEAA